MEDISSSSFGHVDPDYVRFLGNLPAYKRVHLMLKAREMALGLIRGRIKKFNPDLSERELNIKVLETTTHVRQKPP
jgi:hypothetical protein